MILIGAVSPRRHLRLVLAEYLFPFTVSSMRLQHLTFLRHLAGFGLLCTTVGTVLLSACGWAGSAYSVGDVGPGGGVVFYVASRPFPCGPDLATTCRFLEAAPVEGDAVRVWAEENAISSDVPGADGTAIGTGWSNTIAIITQGNTDPDVSAAAYADAYEHNGYSDWYLPSKDEIFELYEYMERTSTIPQRDYWSSTEYVLNSVWTQHAGTGPQYRRMKFNTIYARPVRSF